MTWFIKRLHSANLTQSAKDKKIQEGKNLSKGDVDKFYFPKK